MKKILVPLVAIICMTLLVISTAGNAFAADGSIMNGPFGFEYHIEGVETWSVQQGGISAIMQSGYGTIDSQVVTVSGTLKLNVSGRQQGTFEFVVAASTKYYDENDNALWDVDYSGDGPVWRWNDTIDQLDSDDGRALDVPFSVTIPVPGYDKDNEITTVHFVIHCLGEIYHPLWTSGFPQTDRDKSICSIHGELYIPEDLKPKPVVVLTTNNGGKLDPLRVKFRLTDNSTTPPQPLKNTVIRVEAPIRRRPPSLEKDFTTAADWSLSGYFVSRTKCPNCNSKQSGKRNAGDTYYYLKDLSQPIEVLTDDQGRAELLFLLDLPALAEGAPDREHTLTVPIHAEYLATQGEFQGEVLAEANLNINLNHIGYVESVTYVEPQEWEPVGGLGDYRPAAYNPAEYPLESIVHDPGTGIKADDVRGCNRALIAIQLTDAGNDSGYGVGGGTPGLDSMLNLPTEVLRPGTLIAPGDRIDIDARGLVNYKPVDSQSPESGIRAKPGWIWVKVKFFDGLTGKVGANGICGKHSVYFGDTPYQSGWLTPGWAAIRWVGREGAEGIFSKYFVPIYGQVDMVNDVATFIKWYNDDVPIYLRLRSEVVITHDSDGNSRVTVVDGQPDLVTEQTGATGVHVASGETALVSPTTQIKVSATDAETAARAAELVAGLSSGAGGPDELEPIELTSPATQAPSTTGHADEAGDVPFGHDEAGDVPIGHDEAGDVPLELDSYYNFDEFRMGIWEGWTYTPESDDSFASFSHDEIPLYIVIARAQASSAEMLELLEMEGGSPEELELDGHTCHIYPLLEDGGEFGMMLSFDKPLANGNRLHILFFSDNSVWADMTDMVIQLLLGMGFDR